MTACRRGEALFLGLAILFGNHIYIFVYIHVTINNKTLTKYKFKNELNSYNMNDILL